MAATVELEELVIVLCKGVVKGAVRGQFKHEYESDCEEHPSASVASHVGHAIGATGKKMFNVFFD